MNIMTFKGITNRSLGVIVETMPALTTPMERGESVVIAGRDGTVWRSDDCFDMIDITPTLYVPQSKIADARQWLTGSGDLSFGLNANWHYRARVSQSIPWQPLDFEDGYRAAVAFECQPFRYKNGSAKITVTRSGYAIRNEYGVPALPVLTVHGSGTGRISIGDTTCELTAITDGMVLDCEEYEAYYGNQALNHVMVGPFPFIPPGETGLIFTGGITSIELEPRWRML